MVDHMEATQPYTLILKENMKEKYYNINHRLLEMLLNQNPKEKEVDLIKLVLKD